MKTNTSITIYHKVFDTTQHLDTYKKIIVKNVMFQGGKGASINKGYDRANDLSIYIPYSKNDLTNFDISIGDIVIRDLGPDKIEKQTDLTVDSYNITTIIDNNYGSNNVNHIFIGAK